MTDVQTAVPVEQTQPAPAQANTTQPQDPAGVPIDSANANAPAAAADAELPTFDPTQRKKRKGKTGGRAKTTRTEEGTTPAEAKLENGEQAAAKAVEEDYSYEYLLGRAFEMIGQSGQARHIKIPAPQAYLIGTKKTQWANFPHICKAIQRTPQHLLTYVCIELGTTANLDGNGRLVISGRFMLKQVESVLRTYVDEYVTCKTCGSRDTSLKKENRLYFVECRSAVCGSRRTVPALNKGYVHTIKRKK